MRGEDEEANNEMFGGTAGAAWQRSRLSLPWLLVVGLPALTQFSFCMNWNEGKYAEEGVKNKQAKRGAL